MQDSIPEPWDHDLSQRQMFDRLSHPGAPVSMILLKQNLGSMSKPALSAAPLWAGLPSGDTISSHLCIPAVELGLARGRLCKCYIGA